MALGAAGSGGNGLIWKPGSTTRQIGWHTSVHRRPQPGCANARCARDLVDVDKHASSSALALSGRVLSMASSDQRRLAPLANCSIINVPGPSSPLYLAGARLADFSGLMPICDGLGLVLTATSYGGSITISVTSRREQMPDPTDFAQCLQQSFEHYRSAVGATRHRRKQRSPSALVG